MSQINVPVQPSADSTVITITVPPTQAQPAVAAASYPRMQFGTNVESNDPWSSAAPWCDVARQLTGWYPAGGAGAATAWDVNGYPNGHAFCHGWLYGYPSGEYHLHWDGPQNALTVDGKVMANVKVEGSGFGADIAFTSGDYVQLETAGGISNVHLYSPDNVSGQTFRTAYLNYLKPYKIMRLMPLARVNSAAWPTDGNGKALDFPTAQAQGKIPWPTTWAQRVQPTGFDQTSRELALELQLELAKEAGCIPWVNLYFGSDDDSIAKTAQLIASYNFPMVVVEYQNELWNQGGGYQGNLVRNEALRLGTFGSIDPNVAGARYAASLAAHAGAIFRQVIGASKVKVVFGAQATYAAWATNGLSYLKPGDVDILAVAPYFQPADAMTSASTVAQVMASCQKWIDTILAPGLAANAQAAKTYGADFWAYEGGQSLLPLMAGAPNVALQPDNAAQATAFTNDPMTLAQNDPCMSTLYNNLFVACRNAGMTTFTNFMAVGNWGRSGYWGLASINGELPNRKATTVAGWVAAQNS